MRVPALEHKNTIIEHAVLRKLSCNSLSHIRQEEIDRITPAIMEWLAPEDIHDHMVAVYDKTAEQYADNPHNIFVTDELIDFVAMLKEKDAVLDIGCGTGRDSWFMAWPDQAFRKLLMQREADGRKTYEKYPVPTKSLTVRGIDASEEMIEFGRWFGDWMRVPNSVQRPLLECRDMHKDLDGFADASFAGVWSCASYLTHTPRQWVESTLAQIARILAPSGVFAVSYTQRQPGHGYDYLKLSSIGEIKYFSQPVASEIVDLAKNFDLLPIRRAHQSDYVDNKSGAVVTGLFVTQFFRKE